ncbi:MAG TPA: ester cyclase [Vicinamibacterales bacterium]|nr:ester cyclase [Vicinamibacterales bacterium]
MGQHEDKLRDLVLKMYDDVWNNGRFEIADVAISKDFDDHPPTRFFDVGRRGPDALVGAAKEFRSAAADFHDAPELCLVEGDRVAYLGQISGTQTKPMFGFPASGRRLRVWGVNFYRMENDQIRERWGQFDVLTMMQQLGLAPGPPMPEVPAEGPKLGDPRRAGREDSKNIAANKAVYARMVEEVVNNGHFDVVDELFHPDYIDHAAPPGAPPGPGGAKEVFKMFRTGFPDVKFTIDQMVGEGNYVATLVHGEGTQTGQFIQFPPSGKHAIWRSVGFFRVEDGRIREHWGIPDLLGLLIQIGIIPPPAAASGAGTVEAQVK